MLFGGSDVLSVGFSIYFRRKHRHNFVPFGFSVPYVFANIGDLLSLEQYTLWCFFGGSDILSRRKYRHNFVPFGFSLTYDVQILAIFYLWNTIRFDAFWGF